MPFLPFAAGLTLPFLGEIVALLAASVLIAYLCYRINLVPIVGFLLAGVVIGPTALGLVSDQALIDGMAEVGVILLLFTIGVEFSLEKLARIRTIIIGGGGLQVGLTVAAVGGLLVLLGTAAPTALFTGCLVALSSTAIVLKLLNDRSETDTPAGRFSLAILIFQDFAIIAMVLFVSAFSGEDATAGRVLWALAQAGGLVALVVVGARRIVPWLLERVARTHRPELFLPTVVAICFGTAWLTSLADVSLALGAFLAGLVVSESRHSAHALAEILPLRTLFNAIFFVSVGMLLDLRFLVANLPLVLGVAAGVLVLKLLFTLVSVRLMGYPLRIAMVVGLSLAQIGEFSFVLARAGESAGMSPAGLGEMGMQTFIAVTVLLMALTPLLMQVAPRLSAVMNHPKLRSLDTSSQAPESATDGPLEDHVVVIGYGPAGERLTQVLHDTGLPFALIELNPALADDARARGIPVIQGDATRPHILEHAHVDTAKMCVLVLSDDHATERICRIVRHFNPTVQIIARTRYLASIEPLHDAGADVVVPEELETAVRIFTQVLDAYLIPKAEIQQQISAIRSDDYQVFRGSIQEAHLMVLQGLDDEGLHTRAVAVREGAPVAGQSLREAALRQTHNLTVLAVRRDGRTQGNPDGDFRIQPGDRLVLVGTAEEFRRSAHLFRS